MAAELLPTLFAVDGVLTTIGTIASAVQPLIAAAQIGTLTYQLQQLTELGEFSKNRAVQAQSQNNINNLRSNKLEDPNQGTGNAGNDSPKKEPSWWEKICIGPCNVYASEEGERPGGTGSGIAQVRRRPPGSPIRYSEYVITKNGRVIRIPLDWEGRVGDKGTGMVWQKPGTTGNANSIRIMDAGVDPRYPQGYIRYYNSSGQPLDIYGKTGTQAATHIPLDYNGPMPGLGQIYK